MPWNLRRARRFFVQTPTIPAIAQTPGTPANTPQGGPAQVVASLVWDEAPKRTVNAGAPFWLDITALDTSSASVPAGALALASTNTAVIPVPADPGPVAGSVQREVRFDAGMTTGAATITVTAGGLTLTQDVTVVAAPADRYRHGLRVTAPRTYDDAGTVTGNLTVDTTTKRLTGPYPSSGGHTAPFRVARPTVVNTILLTDSGNTATNRANLVAAITTAQSNTSTTYIYVPTGEWGDQIVVDNPNGGPTRQIVIADDRYRLGTFPKAEGVDVLGTETGCPTFTSTTATGSILLGHNAKWVRLMGLKCQALQDANARLGGLITSREANSDIIYSANAADYPAHVVIEQCYLDGLGCARGAWVNGIAVAWLNCRIDRVNGASNGDSQGLTISAAGPYYLQDGYIACNGGESFAFGTGAAPTPDMVPHDGWVDGTILAGYDLGTRGSKNVAECKGARRWAFTGYAVPDYVATGYGTQYGQIAIKSSDSGGGPWNYARDIMFRGGLHTNTSGFVLSVLAADVRCDHASHRVDCSHISLTSPHASPPSGGSNITSGSMFVLAHDIVYRSAALGGGYDPTSGLDEPEGQQLRDVAIHHCTMDGGPLLNADTAAFVYYGGDGDSNEARTHRMELRGNVDARADTANYHEALILWPGRLTGGPDALAALTSRGMEPTTSNGGLTSSALTGNIHNNTTALVSGDTAVANYAAFSLGARGIPNAGSPVLIADIDGGRAGVDSVLVPSLRAY